MSALLAVTVFAFMGPDGSSDDRLSAEIVEAAERTGARLQKEGAKWTVRHDVEPGEAFEVAVEQFPTAAHFELRVIKRGRRTKMFAVTARDGVWYVEDGQSRGRYRPYEAPLPLPTGVHFLRNSLLRLVQKETLRDSPIVSIEPSANNRLAVRVRGSEIHRENLRSLLAKLEELTARRKAAGQPVPIEQVRQIDELKDRLSNGFPLVVDRDTGIVLDNGLPPREVHIRGFEWQGTESSPKWEGNAGNWRDHTRPLSAEEMKDVIQIGHTRLWSPGAPSGLDTDLMLLNVRTGEVRRLPFPLGLALSGCFSIDRQKAYVPGSNLDEASVTLFEVNLATGETVAVGDDTLRHGMWMGLVLSPDGRSLAATRILQGKGLASQIYVIDLVTQKSRAIGEAMDFAFLDWHPDGKSLFCAVREPDPPNEFPKSWITQVSLDGETRRLREGGFPRLLPALKRFLFEDSSDGRRLKTCDLEGGDMRLFGDGFRGFGFPTPSPDGRLLMMKFVEGKPPQPCLVDMATFRIEPVPVGPGLWGRPAWK